MVNTPAYIFDLDKFCERVTEVKKRLGDIPLTYAMKANPLLLGQDNSLVDHFEVCSPGELEICIRNNISPKRIIYSGVMKESADIEKALELGVDIITAESIMHVQMIQKAAAGKQPVKVLLRLSSGNQFGMSTEDIDYVLANRTEFCDVIFYGIHYYSGTQKSKPEKIDKDLERIKIYLDRALEKYGYSPELVEYGPGLAVDYFGENDIHTDYSLLDDIFPLIEDFHSMGIPIGIEMGRFLAASCGKYITTVKDIKNTDGVTYAILDGGIHHINYYGQMMAMKIPPIYKENACGGEKEYYCLCGSLCTTADVLVRKVEMEKLQIGDSIVFDAAGAYSSTEAPMLFLSRDMPEMYYQSEAGGEVLVRGRIKTNTINA